VTFPAASRSGSPLFDERAAGHYDAVRVLHPETRQQIVRMLQRELAGRGRCLDAGVGTGRFALPLAEAGIPIVGVELSASMLAQLKRKVGMTAAIPLVQADATALPFANRIFGAGLVCHGLHLIPEWQRALAELCRVIRPGGVILLDLGAGRGQHRERRAIHERFRMEAGLLLTQP